MVLTHYSTCHGTITPSKKLKADASYLISENVVYLVFTEKSYPRKLAFSYLDELSKEFAQSYGAKVDSVRKPYAFVGFGASAFYFPLGSIVA